MKTIIEVEIVPNFDVRVYHTNFELSKSHIENFLRPIRKSSQQYLNRLGHTGGTTVRRLFKIDGIADVTIMPYSVTIQKGKAFYWDKIEPTIMEILEKAAPKPKVEINTEEAPETPLCPAVGEETTQVSS